MAVVLEISFHCNNMLDIGLIKVLLNNYNVSIENICSIDNWIWENKREMKQLENMKGVLDENRIIVMNLKKDLVKDMGIYVEKTELFYVYTLWVNTEGYKELDLDLISHQNRKFYQQVYCLIAEINRKVGTAFEIIAIGLETNLFYGKKIEDILNKSKNVVAWVLRDNLIDEWTNWDYTPQKLEGLGMKLFEKIRETN